MNRELVERSIVRSGLIASQVVSTDATFYSHVHDVVAKLYQPFCFRAPIIMVVGHSVWSAVERSTVLLSACPKDLDGLQVYILDSAIDAVIVQADDVNVFVQPNEIRFYLRSN